MTITPQQIAAATTVLFEHGITIDDLVLNLVLKAAEKAAWVEIKTIQDMPIKPCVKDYEYVETLIFHNGEIKQRPWNCEHKVFDDECFDDFYCEYNIPTHYRLIPCAPNGD